MRPRRRAGFTLIELAVVIVIIAILSALLLPALTSAIRTARNSTQAAEMQVLSAALESFRTKYGEYPPSRIMLCEDGFWNAGDTNTMIPVPGGGSDISYGELAQQSSLYLQKYWPLLWFAPDATKAFDGSGTWYDFNGNGVLDKPAVAGRGVILQGTECLAFFLGGVPLNTGTSANPQISLSGFARGKFAYPTLGDPQRPQPFRNNLDNGNRAFGGDREKPSYEFKADRLIDADSNGMPEYADSLGTLKPIAYFRAGDRGYDPNDVNYPEPDTSGTVPVVLRTFRVSFVVQVSPTAKNTVRQCVSPGPNPYSTNPADTGTTTAWHRANSFQLISAGRDGLYGPGGSYLPNATADKLPLEGTGINTTDATARGPEKDNISNITSGTLD